MNYLGEQIQESSIYKIMFFTTKSLFHLSLPSRLVCSLAALPVQVQVPARACRGRQHPTG